jgi:hypothetical protein
MLKHNSVKVFFSASLLTSSANIASKDFHSLSVLRTVPVCRLIFNLLNFLLSICAGCTEKLFQWSGTAVLASQRSNLHPFERTRPLIIWRVHKISASSAGLLVAQGQISQTPVLQTLQRL